VGMCGEDSGSGYGPAAVSYEYGNALPGSTTGGEFLD
jgi:hypothetical protein